MKTPEGYVRYGYVRNRERGGTGHTFEGRMRTGESLYIQYSCGDSTDSKFIPLLHSVPFYFAFTFSVL